MSFTSKVKILISNAARQPHSIEGFPSQCYNVQGNFTPRESMSTHQLLFKDFLKESFLGGYKAG